MSCNRCGQSVTVDGALCLVCQWQDTSCRTENCDAVMGAPHDRNGFCADCADAIEEQDREHAMGDEQ